MKKQKIRRTRYLINKRFQLGHIFWMILLQSLIAAGIGLAFSWMYLEEGNLLGFTLAVGTFFLLIGGLSLAFTHSIAGPLFKLGNAIRQITDGSLPERPFAFRSSDNFKWLAKDFDRYLDRLATRHANRKNAVSNLKTLQNNIRRENLSNEECIAALESTVALLNR